MADKRKPASSKKTRRPPATTPEARQNQLVAQAVDLAEKQIQEGTASAQVITHFLKLATVRDRLELEKLAGENELLRAKSEAIASGQRIEALYDDAIKAMRTYSGQEVVDDSDD